MELVLIYLWLKLDLLLSIISGFLWLSAIGTAATLPPWETDSYSKEITEELERLQKAKERRLVWRKRWATIFMGLLIPFLLIPNSKETATLVLSHYALSLAQSPEGEKVFKLIRATANNILDAELQKLQPVKK